jgi:fructokinase
MNTSTSPINSLANDKYVLAIGESLIDALNTGFVADLSEAKTPAIHPGGNLANLCRFVQACGGKAILVAAVGKDGLGKILLQALQKSGITTDYIQQLAAHSNSMIVLGCSTGTPDFIPYCDADRFLQPVKEELISGAALLHTTAFALNKDLPGRTFCRLFRWHRAKVYPSLLTGIMPYPYGERQTMPNKCLMSC